MQRREQRMSDAPDGWTEEHARMVEWETSEEESGDLPTTISSDLDDDAEDVS
jgi:hypothetical protein